MADSEPQVNERLLVPADGVASESAGAVPATTSGVNLRVRQAMTDAGMTFARLAETVGCSMKTAQRWSYEGRTPRRDRAVRAAAALNVSVSWLWPSIDDAGDRRTSAPDDRITSYSSLGDLPDDALVTLITTAQDRVDVVADDRRFLERTIPTVLMRAGDAPLRILLTPSVRPSAKRGLALAGYVRRTRSGSGCCLLRGDDVMLLIYDGLGSAAYDGPALLIHRAVTGGVFDRYADRFDALWSDATPPASAAVGAVIADAPDRSRC